jgi:hypothetical protein
MNFRKRAKTLVRQMNKNTLALAQILHDIHDTKMYQKWGFRSFYRWADEDLNFGKRTAERLIAIHTRVVIPLEGKVSKQELEELGISKLRLLARCDKSTLIDRVAKAKAMTVHEFELALRRERLEEDASFEVQNESFFDMHVRLTAEEAREIQAALMDIRERENIRRLGKALAVLVGEWNEVRIG